MAITKIGAIVVHLRRSETTGATMPFGILVLAILVAASRFGPYPL